MDKVFLDINTAVPLGLILNELITNAFKHAFHGKEKGNILISFKKNQNKQFHLVVKDDGVGLPKHFDIEESKSLGLQLVRILTEQIQGKLSITKRNGMTFRIHFTGV